MAGNCCESILADGLSLTDLLFLICFVAFLLAYILDRFGILDLRRYCVAGVRQVYEQARDVFRTVALDSTPGAFPDCPHAPKTTKRVDSRTESSVFVEPATSQNELQEVSIDASKDRVPQTPVKGSVVKYFSPEHRSSDDEVEKEVPSAQEIENILEQWDACKKDRESYDPKATVTRFLTKHGWTNRRRSSTSQMSQRHQLGPLIEHRHLKSRALQPRDGSAK